jgi:hypothetical protein
MRPESDGVSYTIIRGLRKRMVREVMIINLDPEGLYQNICS